MDEFTLQLQKRRRNRQPGVLEKLCSGILTRLLTEFPSTFQSSSQVIWNVPHKTCQRTALQRFGSTPDCRFYAMLRFISSRNVPPSNLSKFNIISSFTNPIETSKKEVVKPFMRFSKSYQ
jgi:hypothetical protein